MNDQDKLFIREKINSINESWDRVETLVKELEEIDKRIEQKMKYILGEAAKAKPKSKWATFKLKIKDVLGFAPSYT